MIAERCIAERCPLQALNGKGQANLGSACKMAALLRKSEIITNAKSAAGLEDIEAWLGRTDPRVARDGRRTPMVGHW
jgi:hypothetical protein